MWYNCNNKPKKPCYSWQDWYREGMNKLSESEIQKRLQELRNLRVLHRKAVEKNVKLEEENKSQKERISILEDNQEFLLDQVEALKLQLEEFKQIIFGRKKKKKDDDDNDIFTPKKEKKKPKERSKDSYKRAIPDEDDITAHEHHGLDSSCQDCGTNLEDKETIVFYEEDIPLPNKEAKLKQIIKHHVEKGYCPNCRKWHTAYPLPSAKVILGNKVRLYIAYLSILLRLSFSQIQSLLWDTYHFKISDGEIAKILHKSADNLRPEFERIKKKLQKGRGVHLDETSWGEFYLWVMVSMDNDDVLYLAGRTRGKGNADELLGHDPKTASDSIDFVLARITDAYAAYKNQPGPHQQCWSHPHTKLEQLAYSKTLSKETREHCYETYSTFEEVYAELRGYIKEPFSQKKRNKQKLQLLKAIEHWRQPNSKDPKKLHKVKQQFYDYLDEWFTCMDYDGMPCDNNKAERKLRHFVIKRKISFGNKSKKGHETFSILTSVLMTYWKTHKNNFFPQLSALCA